MFPKIFILSGRDQCFNNWRDRNISTKYASLGAKNYLDKLHPVNTITTCAETNIAQLALLQILVHYHLPNYEPKYFQTMWPNIPKICAKLWSQIFLRFITIPCIQHIPKKRGLWRHDAIFKDGSSYLPNTYFQEIRPNLKKYPLILAKYIPKNPKSWPEKVSQTG